MWTKFLQGLAAIFSGQVIITVGNLVLVPLFLTRWSTGAYGEWLAMFSLVGYLGTLDLGMNMAVTNRLTQAYARRELDEYTRCQHSAMAFYLCLAFGASLLLGGLIWILPIPAWLGLREIPSAVAGWVIWLLGLQILWAMPAGLITGIYRTTGSLAKSQWLGNMRQVAALGLVAVVLILGGGMVAVALSLFIPLIILSFLVLYHLHRSIPDLVPRLTQASPSVIRGLVPSSLLFGGLMLAGAITMQGPVIVVSSALGGVAVALFVTTRTLSNLVRQVIGALGMALWPDLTFLETRKEYARLRPIHRLLVSGSTALCIAVAAALWYEGGEIITVWTRGKLPPDVTLLRLLLVQLVLQCPWLASGVFTVAANRHKKLSLSWLISAIVGIGGAVLLVNRWGIWGVPIGLMAGEALACAHFIPYDTCRMLGEPYGLFAVRTWLGLAATAAAALFAGFTAHHAIPGPALIRWAGVGICTSFVSLGMAWYVYFTAEDRNVLIKKWPPLKAIPATRICKF